MAEDAAGTEPNSGLTAVGGCTPAPKLIGLKMGLADTAFVLPNTVPRPGLSDADWARLANDGSEFLSNILVVARFAGWSLLGVVFCDEPKSNLGNVVLPVGVVPNENGFVAVVVVGSPKLNGA